MCDDTLSLVVGGVPMALTPGCDETDDATFVRLSDKRILISGDFVIRVFPSAGNPRKVQRSAADWIAASRFGWLLRGDAAISVGSKYPK